MIEPYGRKKSEGPKRLLGIALVAVILGALGLGGWFYGPALYFQFSGDAIIRISKKADAYESRLLSEGQEPADLYAQIEETRRILNLVERENPVSAEAVYYQGLFDFFELMLRLKLDGQTLVQLTGRGYLPPESTGHGLPAFKASDLARRAGIRMRKALALDPGLAQAPIAGLVIAYSDVLVTSRTDPLLYEYLKRIKISQIREAYRPYALWMSLALYALQGRKAELESLAQELEKPGTPLTAVGFKLDKDSLQLVLCHGMFHAKDYLRALDLTRQVRASKAPDALRAEAARMEGEIFLVQSGPDAARPHFEEAKRLLGGKDAFMDERLKAISDKETKR
ncbi:MAG: hypothetical protein HY042_01465 [Spirochaetia bacterium]|nr:hypothetical protein [Spirochaetia bacterium]